MKSALVQYHNCRILWKHKIIREDLWVQNGVIQDPLEIFFGKQVTPDVKVDCHDLIIAPGYIDIHLNGGFKVDFSSNVGDPKEGLKVVAKNILKYGVTSFCPTIVTSPDHIYHKILPKMSNFDEKDKAGILGVHIEGPFISKEKRGAHPLEFIKEFKNGFKTMMETYGSLDNVKIVTLSPELENSPGVVEMLTSMGIKVAMGHSATNLAQAEEAVRRGASIITHLFNAMLIFHNRDPGLFGLLTSNSIPNDRQLYYSVIADGLHVHPASLRLAYKTSPKGVILITDAITAMGLEPGTYQLGQQRVTIDGVGAYLTESNILAGSIATMSQCVKTFRSATSCQLEEAIEAATLHPALCLGVQDRKGTLDYGSDADFIFLDDNLNVLATFVAGNNVYTSPELSSKGFEIQCL